ncbi:transposase [Arthrobacter sp. GCM10027362]|uniref:transposase n=1 Tax=Arthrobacter sp. GCM10027362 TaxID=3273379 RepID=UPI00362D10E7
MTVFDDAAPPASRAGRCPGQYESAGKSTSGKTRKGNKWLRTYLHDAASVTVRSKNTYYAAQYARIKGRRGHAKAPGAARHSIPVALFHLPGPDGPFHESGPGCFIKRHNPERRARRLISELTTLGYTVTAEAPAA